MNVVELLRRVTLFSQAYNHLKQQTWARCRVHIFIALLGILITTALGIFAVKMMYTCAVLYTYANAGSIAPSGYEFIQGVILGPCLSSIAFVCLLLVLFSMSILYGLVMTVPLIPLLFIWFGLVPYTVYCAVVLRDGVPLIQLGLDLTQPISHLWITLANIFFM